jgi:hypothetical protein
MKSALATFFLVIVFLTCYGQEEKESVPFIAYWSTGDSYNFRVTRIKQNWKDGELEKNDSSSYDVNFMVIDSTDTHYKIKWSYLTNFSEFNIPEELVDMFSKYKLTEVVYLTNQNGEFVGIENWEEISEMMKALFEELIKAGSRNGDGKQHDLKTAMQPLLNIYNSKEGIEQLVFKELQFFHFPFGYEFSINQPLVFEEQLPNMFGGEPLNAESKVYLEEVNLEDSFCVLVKEMKLNPIDSKELLSNLFKSMKLEDDKFDELMKNAKIEINDNNRFEYYFYPGVPNLIKTNRETNIEIDGEKGKRIEKIIIELL